MSEGTTTTCVCTEHRDRAASTQCSECGKTLCEECSSVERGDVYCAACVPTAVRRRIRNFFIGYACLWLLIGVMYAVFLRTHMIWYNIELPRWVEDGHYWRVRALLAFDATYADAETYKVVAWHPLHKAAEHGRVDFLELFLASGADADAPGCDGWRPLHVAVWKHQTDSVQVLLDAGADPNVIDENGMTPLAWATVLERRATIDQLLAAGADPCAAGEESFSALHVAVRKGDHTLVDEFAAGRTLTGGELGSGETPLHYAAHRGDVEVVRSLVPSGLSVDRVTSWRPRSVEQFPEAPDLSSWWCSSHTIIPMDLVRMDEEPLSYDETTALHLATERGHVEIMSALLEAGADASATNDEGETPLHWAVALANSEAVALLMEAGADLDAADKRGMTPLHWAAREGQLDIVKQLVTAGADVTVKRDMQPGESAFPRRVGLRGGGFPRITPEYEKQADTKTGTALHDARIGRHADVVSYLEPLMPVPPAPRLIRVTHHRRVDGVVVETVYEGDEARTFKQDWDRAQQAKQNESR